MTDPGLTNRLRQHSRRAGLAVGLSMALTIAVCLGGFVWIFAEVDPFLRDFIAAEREPTEEPEEPTQQAQQAPSGNEETEPNEEVEVAEAPENEPAPTETPVPPPTPTSEAFEPDFQANSAQQINLRSGPSTDTEIVRVLSIAEPLQYLNEDEPTDNPAADGNRWMKFRTEDGLEGWIREIDAEPFQE